jgi:seryl-tRNA synthetase
MSTIYIFNDILDIEWRKARVTPWFMAQEGLLGLAEENTVGTTDYEACLTAGQMENGSSSRM